MEDDSSADAGSPSKTVMSKKAEGDSLSQFGELQASGDEDELSGLSDDDTISRVRRAHFAQAAAMSQRRKPGPRSRTAPAMTQKRKMEANKIFHDFTKKLKKDTGITIRSLKGNNVLHLDEFNSSESDEDSDTSDGLSEEDFEVNPSAVAELNEADESYIDPETGDIVEAKKKEAEKPKAPPEPVEVKQEPKTLSISDIIDDKDLDLTKNVEIAEIEGSELCADKTSEDMDSKEGEGSQDFDITEKLKEMGEISVKPVKKEPSGEGSGAEGDPAKSETEDEKKNLNPNTINVRRNIREVMDEKQLDASTLAAQRQESERLARVQEQQRIIREVQRQIALSRQNKAQQRTLALLQGGSSLLKKTQGGHKLNLPNTVLVKLPSGEVKKTTLKGGQLEVMRVPKPAGPSVGQKILKADAKKEVVEIVDSSSGEESSSASSDSDDCIMLSDSEVPQSPEPEEDPGNSGLHVNDAYNIPDEQGRVIINIGHTEKEEDIFLAPQIARIIKPHQIGGVRFLFDNIIESVERFSTSAGFGCILAHSMGLGKTLQIVCFCDIFLRHTTSKTVLCIMPINTLQNWVAEFNMWLPLDASSSPLASQGEVRPRTFPIYVLNDSHKTLQMRAKVVQDWKTTGGVLMIGYELYRLLSMKKDKKPRKKKKADLKKEAEKEKNEEKAEAKAEKAETGKEGNDDTQGSSDNTTQSKPEEAKKDANAEDKPGAVPPLAKPDEVKEDEGKKEDKKEDEPIDEDKKLLDEMYEALVKPGPDLVICDEGHRIKNSHSNISYALKQMRTRRRVVLTGYPLQNNLLEYWCMVDFVRPNYLGSKTEFCNMFERPIQNGQCIDSTPQDIRLMRYRAHVLHSLLVGFVQRRSHAVLQTTLPQKEEYVLLIRMTPLQRQLYDTFMNEVVRCKAVPNPLKAFAICCKIWNHPDVLYYFLKKRSETNAAIEEDLDLEELGATKARTAGRGRGSQRRQAKPRLPPKKGSAKKPAATIPPNTSSGPPKPNYPPDASGAYGPSSYPPYGPHAPFGPTSQPYRPEHSNYPPYPGYQNSGQGYYPPGSDGFNQNYGNNYYQQPPYGSNYSSQYPQNNPDFNQGYNQNYWGNENYFGNSGYYNNQQYPNNQPPQDYQANSSGPNFNSGQPYPQAYPGGPNSQSFTGNVPASYPHSQDQFSNQNRPPYPGPTPNSYQNQQGYSTYPPNASQDQPSFPNGQSNQNYPNQSFSSTSYGSNAFDPFNPQTSNNSYPGFDPTRTPANSYPNYQNNVNGLPNASNASSSGQSSATTSVPPASGSLAISASPHSTADSNQAANGLAKAQLAITSSPFCAKPATPLTSGVPSPLNTSKSTGRSDELTTPPAESLNFDSSNNNTFAKPSVSNGPSADAFSSPFSNFITPSVETKPLVEGSEDLMPAWPLARALKNDDEKPPNEMKTEIKIEFDSGAKIENLDTKSIVANDNKMKIEVKESPEDMKPITKSEVKTNESVKNQLMKSDDDMSEEESTNKNKVAEIVTKDKDIIKKPESKPKPKPKPSKPKPKGQKDKKSSKDKNEGSDSEVESEKEEKRDKEEEAAMIKKAEEMTYDWATELLKDYIPGIIENSAKMELFFFILNESVKMGDRLLLFSQSLFTLNLIEDFLERNYIPGTNCLWERNTTYYRLDGSTSALEREKLINEFNANPHVSLFLVSTRAGSLGINLVGANRVIVFDSSWNPCHDTQAVCRVYRYGQKKPCFVYRFVMDCCLEKKIYDRQINKQGMADRVVDECNPDAVLSMKEITNLCWDNDEKEQEQKDLSEFKDKYLDVIMQRIVTERAGTLSKEPFQHESLLVDRKEKKLSSAEKRLAKRGYEMEKKAAAAPKPSTAYRSIRAADGSIVQRPVASVRPMQHGARWIPADVWRRQGMTAQEMTLPLDVVIPTNSNEKTNIVLKAGQRVMVLKSPKGIYMQLESGKIIAIKTAFKVGQKAGDKDASPIGKKILGARPQPANLPGSLKNNSAITVIPKGGARPGLHKIMTRPSILGQNKMRPIMSGQKGQDFRPRGLSPGQRPFSLVRTKVPMQQARNIRPNLPASVSIRLHKEVKKPSEESNDSSVSKMDVDEESDEDTQVLDSGDDDAKSEPDSNSEPPPEDETKPPENKEEKKDELPTDAGDKNHEKSLDSADNNSEHPASTKEKNNQSSANSGDKNCENNSGDKDSENSDNSDDDYKSSDEFSKPGSPVPVSYVRETPIQETLSNPKPSVAESGSLSLLADEKFPTEAALEDKITAHMDKSTKISLLKNYRHQRPGPRPQSSESTLSQLEKTASSLTGDSGPDFRKSLDDITHSYSPGSDERPSPKSKKKKSPSKPESPDDTGMQSEHMSVSIEPKVPSGFAGGPHGVASLLGHMPSAPLVGHLGKSTPPLGHLGQSTPPLGHLSKSPLGLLGHSTPPLGHLGQSTQPMGHLGQNTPPLGHLGQSAPSLGHLGQSTPSLGHLSQSTPPLGHLGQSTQPLGHLGQSTPSLGHLSQSTPSLGHLGQSTQPIGHLGQSTPSLGHLGQSTASLSQLGPSAPPIGSSLGPVQGLAGQPSYPAPTPAASNPHYNNYPGYGGGYGAYPNSPYYGGYGGAGGYYPPYPTHPHPYPPPQSVQHPAAEPFTPPNQPW